MPVKIKTLQQAAEFLDEAGIAFLFPQKRAPLPSLFEAVTGWKDKPSWDNWDASWDRVWEWKDELPEKHYAWYGHFFLGKPTLISRCLLPWVMALRKNKDVEEAYQNGELSQDSLSAAKKLEELGEVPTRFLRESLGWVGRQGNNRFHRALLMLEKGLWVTKTGVQPQPNGWDVEVVELTARHFPVETAKIKRFSPEKAWKNLQQYLRIDAKALRRLIRPLPGFGGEQP
jgi:hypothetical protein